MHIKIRNYNDNKEKTDNEAINAHSLTWHYSYQKLLVKQMHLIYADF